MFLEMTQSRFSFYMLFIKCSLFEFENKADEIEDAKKETDFYFTNQLNQTLDISIQTRFKRFKRTMNGNLYDAKNGNLHIKKLNNKLFTFNFGITETYKNWESEEIFCIMDYFRLNCDFQGLSIYMLTKKDVLDINLLFTDIYLIQFANYNLLSYYGNSDLIKKGKVNSAHILLNQNDEILNKIRTSLPKNFRNKNICHKGNMLYINDPDNKEVILNENSNGVNVFVHIFYLKKKVSVKIFQNESLVSYSITILKDGFYYLEFDDFIKALVKKKNVKLTEDEIVEITERTGISREKLIILTMLFLKIFCLNKMCLLFKVHEFTNSI